jgi:hypothetical protein
VLEATSGMRRCELAGVRRDSLDLAAGTLEIDVTRVVVDGKVIESDGKTENAQHILALDPQGPRAGLPRLWPAVLLGGRQAAAS